MIRIIEDRSIKPNVVMFTSILDVLFKYKLANEAYYLYFKMVYKRISPSLVTYNVLIDAFYKRERPKEAKNVLAVMLKVDVKPDTFTSIDAES